MVINRRIKFILHCRKKGDSVNGKNLGILMRVTIRGHAPFDFSLGANVDAEYWDEKNQRVKDGFVNENNLSTIAINNAIEDYRRNINEVFSVFEFIEKRVPTPQEVKKDFFIKLYPDGIKEEEKHNFFDIFRKFVETEKRIRQWEPGTAKKFINLIQYLEKHFPDLSFAKLSENKLQEIVDSFFESEWMNSTVYKNVRLMKWFLKWANKKGYFNGKANVLSEIKIKGGDGGLNEPVHLTIEELNRFKNYQFNEFNKYLEPTRDVFLFCCHTGLRHSDVIKLKKNDVKDGYINIVTQKDTEALKIELSTTAQQILNKYKDMDFGNGKALPVLSNPKMNAYLKEIGKLCQLDSKERRIYFKKNERHEEFLPKWSLLTTHVGRKTFVVTGMSLKIPESVIMKLTGHSSSKAMKPYMKVVDTLKQDEMKKFDQI